MMTFDTSGLYALLNRRDGSHERVKQAFLDDAGPFILPAGILAEAAYMIERALQPEVLDAFLEDIMNGVYGLDCGDADFPRIRALVRQYADMPLGFADAAVVACAERHGGRILTLDWRHFGAVAGSAAITIVPM
jgi:predicted nucleic acid-binding protein